VPFVTRRRRQSTTYCPLASLLGNSDSSYCSEWVWELFHLRLQRSLFKNGGAGSSLQSAPLIERASTPSSFLGLGRFGGTTTIVFSTV
jgi:hypothetical protein